MVKAIIALCLSTGILLLFSCGQDSLTEPPGNVQLPLDNPSRWYAANQVDQGREVFAENCASCHGPEAQGLHSNWREKLPNGFFPPPPLNGSAHAWHHPLSVLLEVIDQGGVSLGGTMPGFENMLSKQEKLAAIAYFQDFWNVETYENWLQMGGTN